MTDAPDVPRRLPGGLARVTQDEPMSVLETMGGVRGLIESALPAVIFSVSYPFVQDVRTCAVVAVAVAALIFAVRLVQRQQLTPAVSAFAGVLLAAWIATHTGRPSNFYLLSILRNAGFAVLYGASALVRWPLLGLILGQLFGEGLAWREDQARRRVYTQATWLWTGMFAVRFVIEIALWIPDKTTALGLAMVPLGLPLYGLVLLATWVIIRRVPTTKAASEPDADEAEQAGPEPVVDATGPRD